MNEYRRKKENSNSLIRILYVSGGVLTALASAAFTMHVLAAPTYGAAISEAPNTVLMEEIDSGCNSDT